ITDGTTEGDLVFGMIRHNQHLFCPDMSTSAPLGWRITAPQTYKSFAAVPVAAGQNAFGMLMVDSLDVDGVRRSDVPLIRLLGGPRKRPSALAAPLTLSAAHRTEVGPGHLPHVRVVAERVCRAGCRSRAAPGRRSRGRPAPGRPPPPHAPC